MTTRTVQHLLDPDWIVGVQEALDAYPTSISLVVEPAVMGQYCAELGQPCEPTKYYTRLGDVEAFIIAYNDTTALWAEMVQAKNDELAAERNWMDGELQELLDGRDDEDFWRLGQW